MRVTVLSGLSFALLFMLVKMLAFWTGIFAYDIVPLVFINMLFVLLSVAVGLYLDFKQTGSDRNLLLDIKNGMTAAFPYTLAVSVFLYVYYANIDPGFNKHQIAEAHLSIEQIVNDPERFAELKKSNEAFEVMSKEEIAKELKNGPENFYSPKSTMTITLLALLIWGTLNSILVTLIYRKFIFR